VSVVKTQTVSLPETAAQTHSPASSVRTYSLTFATEFSVMLSQIALYKLAANWLGQTGFSEYALARRVLALLQPVALLGFGVGLPRYLGLADGRGESSRSWQYLSATFICVGGFTGCIVLCLLIFPKWFSYLFFGNASYTHLVLPLAIMLVGTSFQSIFYAFLRGKVAVARANVLQLINNCLVPLAVFALFHKDAPTILRNLGLAWILVTSLIFVFTPVTMNRRKPLQESRELLRYGIQRVPGDFALMALLALPAIFAAHLGGIRQAGLVAFGLAIVNMVASVFAPIGIFLLPNISRAIGGGSFQAVRHEIVLIRRLTLLVSGAAVLGVELFGGRMINIYLGHDYVAGISIVSILALGGLPLAFYYALRSALDAFHHRAVNTLNLLVALALFLAGSGVSTLFASSQSILWVFAAAITLLAALTQCEIQKILKICALSVNGPAATMKVGMEVFPELPDQSASTNAPGGSC
jgi:O-antigen/teichoic acid export membrane protein